MTTFQDEAKRHAKDLLLRASDELRQAADLLKLAGFSDAETLLCIGQAQYLAENALTNAKEGE